MIAQNVICRREKIIQLLLQQPMTINDIVNTIGIERDCLHRDLQHLYRERKLKKRYCHWNNSFNAHWVFYICNSELEDMDDEFTPTERVKELLLEGEVINYLNISEYPDGKLYTYIKRLREKGWQIGERKVDASLGRYKEFFLIH